MTPKWEAPPVDIDKCVRHVARAKNKLRYIKPLRFWRLLLQHNVSYSDTTNDIVI